MTRSQSVRLLHPLPHSQRACGCSRIGWRGIMIVWCFAMLGTAVAQSPASNMDLPYAARGPHSIGIMEIVITEAERTLPVTVWYPAAPQNTHPAPYPLVIWAHGNRGHRYDSMYLMEHLASYGFVVAAADHLAGDTLATYRALIQFPQDMEAIIHHAGQLNGSDTPLAGIIDTSQIIVGGHSLGGYAALAVAGARLNLDEYNAWCQTLDWPAEATAYRDCNYTLSTKWGLAVAAGYNAPPDGLWPALCAVDVDAVIAFAPATRLFGESGLEAVQVPILVVGGAADAVLPPEQHVDLVYDAAHSTQKMLITIDGAGHQVFISPACDDHTSREGCAEALPNTAAAHDLINHVSTAFLLAVLQHDHNAASMCSPDSLHQITGITYRTTMGQIR